MSQILTNPFPFSDDNKRYHTFNYYLRHRYGTKCAKIPLNAGFTCPNRDGTKSAGGCTFCSAKGSGDTILAFDKDLKTQYAQNLERARKKWPGCAGMAYFQSFTNTYAPLDVLKELYLPFYQDCDVTALALATRADCVEDGLLEWMASFDKDTWLEIGLQSVHEPTGKRLNRAHTTLEVVNVVLKAKEKGIKTCVHIMNGLPGESHEDMMETARLVAALHPDAVKIHMLHLLSNTALAREYEKEPFDLLSQDAYVSLVCDQLEVLPADMVIERISGDGVLEDLIGPLWTIKKTAVANDIDKELQRRNSWQSKYYKP